MNKYVKYCLVFFIPIFIFCIGLTINKIAPFGEYIINVYDSKVQYPGFFMALKNFHFYLFNVGFGFNFLGTFTYYLMSPLNLLIHFFDIYHYHLFYFLLIIIKIGLCGVSMQYFLSHEKKHDTLWSIIFSIIYALIGFISSYYYNVFWLDTIIMLPIVLVGINKIIDQKNPLFYIISLALTIILSFYTGYMACIFSVLYFIYKLVEIEKYKDKKIILNFIISSLLAGLISCIVLIPSFYALLNGKASGFSDTYTKYFSFNKNIQYFFYSLTPGNFHRSLVSNGFAQNFCTLFVVCLFITSFFNKNITFKTKIITLIIIIFYLVSYSFNLFDYAWQFFQHPVWWQHRYSFTFSLFLIIIAYKNLMNYNKINIGFKGKLFILLDLTFFILGSFILFYNSLNNKDLFRIFLVGFSILLIINYLFIFNNNKKLSKIIIIIFIFSELLVNSYIGIKANNGKNSLEFETKDRKRIVNTLDEMRKLDNTFYRNELINGEGINDGLLFNYNGINYFNSVRNQNVVNFMENYLGLYVDSHCSINLKKYDPLIISLFDIKYLLGYDKLNYYEQIKDNIYLNKQSLGIGFMTKEDVSKTKFTKQHFQENISNLYSKMIGEKRELYKKIDLIDYNYENSYYNQKSKTYFKLNQNEDAYLELKFKASENMFLIIDYNDITSNIYINDTLYEDHNAHLNSSYIFINKDDNIKIRHRFNNYEEKNIGSLHYISEEEFLNITNDLKENQLENIKLNDKHTFYATINVNKDKPYLFTSIAYEKGMKIYVNGKKVKPTLLENAFITLKLNEGKNEIIIDYLPRGIILGLIISFIGISSTIVYIKKFKHS